MQMRSASVGVMRMREAVLDILHDDHGAIDQKADGDGEAA